MSERANGCRVVVCVPEAGPIRWELPPAELHGRSDIQGGIRTMHELAVAAAASGRSVEMRGPISRPVLDTLAAAAGVRPSLPTRERGPSKRDIVINVEGQDDPLRYARWVLSPARLVLALLAPPGLFGWPFASPWRVEAPTTIALESVARPEHFRAMAALNIDVWTHMSRAHEIACAEGVRCSFIGSGDPVPPAPPVARPDGPVVYLEANRWRALAEEVAGKMRTPVQMIPHGDHATVMDALARARVLLWPARVEGHGRLLGEARARGTVVVGLASNVYATGLDEASGAVAAVDLEHMPEEVESLLEDPRRLEALSQAGWRTAREQVDWTRYVERVDAAITAVEERPQDAAASARSTFGELLGTMLDERLGAIERVAELDAQLATATERVKHLDRELESTCEALREIRVQLDRAGAQASAATAALAVARAAPARHVSSIELMNELARRTTRRLGVR
jgi:hypothetical protein